VWYIHLDATASHHDQAIVSLETGQARTLSEKESVGDVVSLMITKEVHATGHQL